MATSYPKVSRYKIVIHQPLEIFALGYQLLAIGSGPLWQVVKLICDVGAVSK
jgi:hypothetical protein